MDNCDPFFSLKNRNIVVVEDDVSNFRYFETVLKKAQANIHWIKNGRDAVSYCTDSSNNIDLVIMDILIPLITGIKATREIKKVRKDLPVIAVTAYVSRDIQEKCFLAGCDEFLFKPLLPKQLLDIIKHFFEKDQVMEPNYTLYTKPN
ncbi:MAG: response regulator [Bacteroidales bacterium]|nr:response regulator [Bacteroidales bacterium]